MPPSEFDKRFPNRDSAVALLLASTVKRLREAKGWTQGKLADEMGLQQPAISVLENGRANPTLAFLEALAATLGVTFAELFQNPSKSGRKKRK